MELEVCEVVSLEKGRAKISFDNGMQIILYRGEMRRLSLKEGSYISQEQYQYILKDIIGKRAKKRALYLLEKQDRTERQLYDKLKQSEYPEECIEAAIQYVKDYHYIDDERYAKTYIRYHQEKKSLQRLKMDLLSKGVDKTTIEYALDEEFEADERVMIARLLEKKRYNASHADVAIRRKTYQFLLRRGFKSSDIITVMEQCGNNE